MDYWEGVGKRKTRLEFLRSRVGVEQADCKVRKDNNYERRWWADSKSKKANHHDESSFVLSFLFACVANLCSVFELCQDPRSRHAECLRCY